MAQVQQNATANSNKGGLTMAELVVLVAKLASFITATGWYWLSFLIVWSPHILLSGGGALVVTHQGSKRSAGVFLLIFYIMSMLGSLVDESPISVNGKDHMFGYMVGVTCFPIGLLLSWWRRAARTVTT